MTKKERVQAVLRGEVPDKVPSGFSLHFPVERNAGEAGVEAHLEFFRETDTDIAKIMNENLIPYQGDIRTPGDWKLIGPITKETPILQRQTDFTKAILDRAPQDAYFLGTLHGVTACALHPIEEIYGYDGGREKLVEHLRENPQPVEDALKRMAEGMCHLAWCYAEAGVDGIYYAALGGETRWLTDEEFARWIEPLDKLILSEIRKSGCGTFLHICKDRLNMERYRSYCEFCDIVNWGVYEAPYSLEQGKKLFPGKPLMGGLPARTGVMTQGTLEELTQEAKRLAAEYGSQPFILGADCTLPTEIPYQRIRAIVDAAREVR